MLHCYFLPVFLLFYAVFTVYQVLLLPFCYIKMVGHKWALVCKSPKGHETSTTGDRLCRALLFTVFGFVLLLLSVLVDQVWYVLHVYKMDLDKTYYYKASKSETPEIHRRTYKKLFEYFKKGNE
jgi:hypothetical protein